MSDFERELAFLRAAERIAQIAWRWLPYPDELPESARAERDADDILLSNDMAMIRSRLKVVEHRVLVDAQERGEKELGT